MESCDNTNRLLDVESVTAEEYLNVYSDKIRQEGFL